MLAQLGDENWGERLCRARKAACLTVRATADQLTAAGFDVSYATISRLEQSATVPTGTRGITACLALLAYGFDPDDFGLADVRRLINVDIAIEALTPKVAAAATRQPRKRHSSSKAPRRRGRPKKAWIALTPVAA